MEENKNETQELEKKVVNTTIIPETGERVITGEEESSVNMDNEIDNILQESLKEQLKSTEDKEISKEELKEAVETSSESVISDEATAKLLEVIYKYKKNPKINLYKEYPEEIQNMVKKYISNMGVALLSNDGKRLRNIASMMLMDEFIKTIELNRFNDEINNGLNDILEEANKEIGDNIVKYDEERNAKYREVLERIEDDEKREKALKILDTVDATYELTELKEFAKRCKIKRIELDKPQRCYSHIINKYSNSEHNIYDITLVPPILFRNLNDDLENPEYKENDIIAFLIAFCKQCMNMKVEVPEEHAYMYYVLYNIVLMDMVSEENKDKYDTLKASIKEVINNLRTRNPLLV